MTTMSPAADAEATLRGSTIVPEARKPGILQRKRARGEAARRQAQWDELRTPGPAAPPAEQRRLPALAARPADHEPEETAPGPRRPGRGVALLVACTPVVTAFVLIGTASVALPMFGGNWNPVALAGGLVLSAGASIGTWKAFTAIAPRRWPAVAGLAAALVILGSFGAGLATQAVVDGHAQLAGSYGDRVYRSGQEILADADVLTTTQRLLRLPAEQARSLVGTFDAAMVQDVEMEARWNPATAGTIEPVSLAVAYQRINLAAVQQGIALAAQKQNLLSPDPQLAATVASAYAAVEALVGTGPESVSAAVRAAYAEAGLSGQRST